MRMTVVQSSETTVSALAKRLYPNLGESTLKKAEAALLKANPHLRDSAAFKPGATVVLPTIPGVKPRPSATGEDPGDDRRTHLQEAVKEFRTIMAARLDEAGTDLGRQEETLKNRDVVAAINASPEAAALAKKLAKKLAERKKALAEEKRAQEELFARIEEDIAGIFK